MSAGDQEAPSNDDVFMAWQKRWKLSLGLTGALGAVIGLLIGASMESNPGEDVTGLWGLFIGLVLGVAAHAAVVRPWFIRKYGEMPPVPPHRKKWHIG